MKNSNFKIDIGVFEILDRMTIGVKLSLYINKIYLQGMERALNYFIFSSFPDLCREVPVVKTKTAEELIEILKGGSERGFAFNSNNYRFRGRDVVGLTDYRNSSEVEKFECWRMLKWKNYSDYTPEGILDFAREGRIRRMQFSDFYTTSEPILRKCIGGLLPEDISLNTTNDPSDIHSFFELKMTEFERVFYRILKASREYEDDGMFGGFLEFIRDERKFTRTNTRRAV